MSRPKATAPRGRVTLEQAAELAGVSKSLVYRRIQAKAVEARTEPSGSVTIARGDVKLIQPREPAAGDGRKAVMLRPDLERYATWERATAAAGHKAVATWLGELADAAAAAVTKRK